MRIVFLGAPGAGKGTQAATIAGELGLVHVATGDMFRKAIEQGNELGRLAKFYMEKGQLVPDEVTIKTVKMALDQLSAQDSNSGVILDGFPRSIEQAKALDAALKEQSENINKVVYIKVSEEELLRRLSGRWICRNCQTPYHMMYSPPSVAGKCDRCGGELYQRSDDVVETVKERLKVYFKQTAPLIGYYNEENRLVEVDGEGTVDEVGGRILTSLKES